MTTLTALFIAASTQFNLPTGLLESLCYVESKHDVAAVHEDDGGSNSLGVCQIKRLAAQDMGFMGSESDLMDPRVNIYYAAKLLAHQILRYNSISRGVTAYNKGHSNGSGHSVYYTKVKETWKLYENIESAYTKEQRSLMVQPIRMLVWDAVRGFRYNSSTWRDKELRMPSKSCICPNYEQNYAYPRLVQN